MRYASPSPTAAVMAGIPQAVFTEPSPKSLFVGVPFADTGFPDGFRLSNLGGRREIYIPVPHRANDLAEPKIAVAPWGVI